MRAKRTVFYIYHPSFLGTVHEGKKNSPIHIHKNIRPVMCELNRLAAQRQAGRRLMMSEFEKKYAGRMHLFGGAKCRGKVSYFVQQNFKSFDVFLLFLLILSWFLMVGRILHVYGIRNIKQIKFSKEHILPSK